MEDKKRYTLIYGYLLARIHFGFYPKGESLPSLYQLSDIFGVSTMTIRGAVRLLEEKNYISVSQGRRAVVIYSPTPSKQLPDCILPAKETLHDLYKSLYLLLPNLFYRGLRLCEKKEQQELADVLTRPNVAWDEPTTQFWFRVLRQLKNPLLNDLFSDILLFVYPAHLSRLSEEPGEWKQAYCQLNQALRQILSLRSSNHDEGLRQLLYQTYLEHSPYSSAVSSAEASRLPFQWGNPQRCNAIACELIYRIYQGHYPAGSYLPSASKLAQDLSSAVITTRRAVSLLNKLGVIESVNGKGSRTLSKEEGRKKIQWTEPLVQKNIMSYLYALHLLILTFPQIAKATFRLVSSQLFIKTREQVRAAVKGGHSDIVSTLCLNMLIESSSLTAVKEIYGQLLKLLVWGYPLTYLSPRLEVEADTDHIIQSLEKKDETLFIESQQQLFSTLFELSKKKALSVGIVDAKNIF